MSKSSYFLHIHFTACFLNLISSPRGQGCKLAFLFFFFFIGNQRTVINEKTPALENFNSETNQDQFNTKCQDKHK